MKPLHLLALVLLSCSSLHAASSGRSARASVHDGDEEDAVRELDRRDIAGMAAIGLEEAVESALAARPGSAVEAELEGEVDGAGKSVFFEVVIVGTDGKLYEVKLDPQSGSVLSNEAVDDEEDLEELPGFRNVLRHCELPLADLVRRAEAVLKGSAVVAGLELEGSQPVCEVSFANGRYLVDATVEARAGHLVELELDDDDGGPGSGGAIDEDEGDEHHGRGDRDDDGDEHDDED